MQAQTRTTAQAQQEEEADEANVEETPEHTNEEFEAVIEGITSSRQSHPSFSQSMLASRSRAGLTRRQIVVRNTVGYLGRRGSDQKVQRYD